VANERASSTLNSNNTQTLKRKDNTAMRTSQGQAQVAMLWYAERPFAYRCREEYQKRMIIGLIVALGILGLSLASYMLYNAIVEPMPIDPSPQKIVVGSLDVPPPPITPERIEKQQPTGANGADNLLNLNTSTVQGRRAVERSLENTMSALLSQITDGTGPFTENPDGMPKPTEGAQGGLLTSQQGGVTRMDGTTGTQASGLTGANGPMAFESGAQTLQPGELTKGKLGGGEGNRMVVSKRGTLVIRETDRRLQVQSGGRRKEEILATVQSYKNAIYAVYNEARNAAGGSLKGSAVVRIIIAPDGSVRSAEIVQCSINNDNFKRQLVAKVRKMRFSEIKSSTMQQVDIPYEFSEEQ
jgi:TonB family protein